MRDLRIDFMKGMLMWCVVYGHTINALLSGTAHAPIWLHTFVRTFDMPFFMILSGFFLRKSLERRKALDVFVNRLCMILVPIIVWTLLLGRVDFCNRYYFLWAVLCSGIICIAGHALTSLLPLNIRGGLECLYYMGVAVVLHMFNSPWNMFYLFPFFVVGYYLRNIDFGKRSGWIMAVVFVSGLCFWDTAYTPWKIGALAWRDNPTVLLLYGYRFTLGVVGVCTMGMVFDAIRRLCGVGSFFVRTVSNWGGETLALYILQTLCVEIGVRILCEQLSNRFSIMLSRQFVNLIGHVVAPVLSFLFLTILFRVVLQMKHTRILKYAFGFKVKVNLDFTHNNVQLENSDEE